MKNILGAGFHPILVLTLILLLCMPTLKSQAQENPIRVFDSYNGKGRSWIKYQRLDLAWYNYLHLLADRYIDKREKDIAEIKSLSDWKARKKELKQRLQESIGGLPEKTPLNPRITGRIDREKFYVEKILYESQPGFYVSACLFVPKDRQIPAPAIIYCSGHALEAFRSETYQHIILNLVQKGFVVLAYDPIGQGERLAYKDENAPYSINGNTREHSYSGMQALMLNQSLAQYMIHDGIRAVDYLLSREEVDSTRIGITGRSGGGTQSSQIAAFDERIYACAPENYITSFRRIWESIGPQDAEQDLLSAHKLGIDHADLLSIRAPKPALVLTTSRDYFSIQGARDSYAEVKRIYEIFGQEKQVFYAEDDHPHGSTQPNREAMYSFFQDKLALPGDARDVEVELFAQTALTVTNTGNVFSLEGSKSIYDINLSKVDDSKKKQWPNRQESSKDLREIASIDPIRNDFSEVYTGLEQSGIFQVKKYFLEFSDGHYPIPFFVLHNPQKDSKGIILYLSNKGKPGHIKKGSEIESLLSAGYLVISPDMLNTGELRNTVKGDSYLNDVPLNLIYGSSLVAKSLPSLQTEDLLTLLKQVTTSYQQDITLIAERELCVAALHAAVLDGNLKQLILKEPLFSWKNLLETKYYAPESVYTLIPGALLYYDLPELINLLPSSNLTLLNPQGADGLAASKGELSKSYEGMEKQYRQMGGNFTLIQDARVKQVLSFIK